VSDSVSGLVELAAVAAVSGSSLGEQAWNVETARTAIINRCIRRPVPQMRRVQPYGVFDLGSNEGWEISRLRPGGRSTRTTVGGRQGVRRNPQGQPEVPLAFGALSAEEPVIVDGDVDLEVDVAVVTTSEKLDAILEPTVAHPSSLHGG
jgi:hypothetical protein